MDDCLLCRAAAADEALDRVEVWSDGLWRLTCSLSAEVPGFAYLEPRRHIPSVADLDGSEADSFGPALSRATAALRAVTNAAQVYVYIFGDGVPHLHVHLAPHRPGDALSAAMIRGELVEVPGPDGTTLVHSREFPPLPHDELRAVAAAVAARLRAAP